MAEVALTEAPSKRKLEASSEALECKKPRDCGPSDILAVEPDVGNSQEASAQINGEHKPADQVKLSVETGSNTEEADAKLSKNDGNSFRDEELKLSAQGPGSSSATLQELGAIGEGEVLEQDGDEEDGSGELSGLDTENDSEDEEEDAGSDEDAGFDEDEDGSDDASDNEEDKEHILTATVSSLQAEPAGKDKGKQKVDDVIGKSIMLLDKGKGKAIVEDETVPISDEDDAGYLSEDPLEEVDLNNILPTRTRRRSTQHYDFVDQGDNEDDDEDDSDA